MLFLVLSSEFLLSHAIDKEQEDWVNFSVFSVGESKSSFGIETLSGEYLHLVELADDKFDHFGGTFLEVWDSLLLSLLLKEGDNSLEVCLDHGHKILLAKLAFLELMSINNVDDSWSITYLLFFATAESVTSTDINGIISLGDVFGLNLEASTFVLKNLFVGIGDHFVTGEYIDPNSHRLFCI
jgi:hypothetical protein